MCAFRVPILSVVVLVLWVTGSPAAVPASITVQGKLSDAAGVPFPAAETKFGFSIFDKPSFGAQIWPSEGGDEVQPITPTTEGLWTALIGAVSPLTDSVFADSVRWLQINVDGTILPRVRLVTGPYTYRVATIDGASGGTITSKVSIGPGHTNTGADAFVAGRQNVVSGDYSSVPGGSVNAATEFGAVVGGGVGNTASGHSSVVAGGESNAASQSFAAIGGGLANVASAGESTVGGGNSNTASGQFSTVGGGVQNIADDTASAIGGGRNNRARGAYSVVGGGGGFDPADSNAAAGDQSTIAGGLRNIARGDAAAVGGGSGNTASSTSATVGGGQENTATSGDFATVGGGLSNNASGQGATVGGGSSNNASGYRATVGGGSTNIASGFWATVGGGTNDTASGDAATVSGGQDNAASYFYATVGGGVGNTATGYDATVGGGAENAATGNHATVAGGGSDTAGAVAATVGGGINNFATGIFSTVPGGRENVASGMSSFAAGAHAKALHDGTFVWSNGDSLSSTGINQFLIRAPGGVGIGTNSPTDQLHVVGNIRATGCVVGTNIACPSDARLKENIHAVDDAVKSIEKLRGVAFQWKASAQQDRGFPAGKQIGLIAQEVQKVVPQAVVPMTDGYLAVDYTRLVPLLIEGMKEQQKQIDELKAELARSRP